MSAAVILTAIASLGGLGLLFGVLISIAHARLYVWEDPRIEEVTGMLPGANCGACGFAGCHDFATAVVGGAAIPAGCTVMSDDARSDVAAFLGVDVGQAKKVVARLLCAGGSDVAPRKAIYRGVESCAAAVAVSGGGKGCAWGCVGFGDCAVTCTFDAIAMSAHGLPLVDVDKCTACNDCVEACPLNLFTLMPVDHKLVVQCRSLLEGTAATQVCAVACNACGRCAQDAPGLITMRGGLPVIDYDRISLASSAATERCPTNAIVWLEQLQFPAERASRAEVA